jgi:NitT/TauT family transport system substrate-binding protein
MINFYSRIAALCAALLIVGAVQTKVVHAEPDLSFGVLQVLQALPLFVAEEQGFFETAGVEVELVPFQSAADKDIALNAGAIDGYFGDLFTPLIVEGNGLDISIVAANYRTGPKARMFAVLASKASGVRTIKELEGRQVGISSNSVIDYVTQVLLARDGLEPGDAELADMKNIGLRMQLLMSGELDAATLPEPLATAAEKGGATLLADDTGMLVSQTVLIFSQDYLEAQPGEVRQFLSAVNNANAWIAANPVEARKMMIERTRVPEPLQEKFPIPLFPVKMDVPSAATIAEAVAWLRAQGVVKRDLAYTELVNGAYLP